MNTLLLTIVGGLEEKDPRSKTELVLGAGTIAALERARDGLMNVLRKALFELKDFFKYKLPEMLAKAGHGIADATRWLGTFIKTKILDPVGGFLLKVGKAIVGAPFKLLGLLKDAKRKIGEEAEKLHGKLEGCLRDWQANIYVRPMVTEIIEETEKKGRKIEPGEKEAYKAEMIVQVEAYGEKIKKDLGAVMTALEEGTSLKDLKGNRPVAAMVSQLRERLESDRMTLREHIDKWISVIKESRAYKALESGWNTFTKGVAAIVKGIGDAIVKFGHFLGIGKAPEGMITLHQRLTSLHDGMVERWSGFKDSMGHRLEGLGKSMQQQPVPPAVRSLSSPSPRSQSFV